MKTEDKIARVERVLDALVTDGCSSDCRMSLTDSDVYVIREVLTSQLHTWKRRKAFYDHATQVRRQHSRCGVCGEPLGDEPRAEILVTGYAGNDEGRIIHASCFDQRRHRVA